MVLRNRAAYFTWSYCTVAFLNGSVPGTLVGEKMLFVVVIAATIIQQQSGIPQQSDAKIIINPELQAKMEANPARYNFGGKRDGSKFAFPSLRAHALYEEMMGEWVPTQVLLDGEVTELDDDIEKYAIKIVDQKLQYIEEGKESKPLPFIEFHERLNAIEIWNGNVEEFITIVDGKLVMVSSALKTRIKTMKPQKGNFVVRWTKRRRKEDE